MPHASSSSSALLWRPHARPPAQQREEPPVDPYASALARSSILRTLGRRAPARLQLPRSLVREQGFLPGLLGPTPPSDVYRRYGELQNHCDADVPGACATAAGCIAPAV